MTLKMGKKDTIGCIIVTYNRMGKLKKALQSYAAQRVLPQYLIVVDNASTDETGDFLKKWQQKDEGFQKFIIHSEANLGGSGGFYLGEKAAIEKDADWIMIADDDAYPKPDYLEGMQRYIDAHGADDISIVCGKVLQHGSCENFHRGKWYSKWSIQFYTAVEKENYEKKIFYPDFVSYVGILVNKEKLKLVGLVHKDNFIWYDDTEHTYRLGRVGKIVCLPRYSIVHDVDETHDRLSWKSYYGYRNSLNFFKEHFPSHYPFIWGKLFIKTLLCPLKGRTFAEVKVRLAGMRDSLLNRNGKSDVYKPGWRP